MKFAYPYTIAAQDDGQLLVQFNDLEEAFTEGQSPEEAAFNAAEVLSGVLAVRLESHEDIPLPSTAPGLPLAVPSASVQSALLVHFARGTQSLADLARIMETSWPTAARLENPAHWPTLRQLDKAVRSMGRKLVLTIE
ncbi:type II toxin-antitoxin system HicB family antitoxin [Acidithiobacillus sp. IBUN Pt1247-S3]|uniref:type II toxin-antitoxin system HicB family antitoxin n=1 Tax=Acidithiobacillus sp. IBUN Pt1247-S3 TaxID=3166642 RepID=UPI0034E44C1D